MPSDTGQKGVFILRRRERDVPSSSGGRGTIFDTMVNDGRKPEGTCDLLANSVSAPYKYRNVS